MSTAPPPDATPLSIAGLRAELRLSLEAFGERIGLQSKGNVSVLERGGPCSLAVALALEQLSGGRLDAAALNADVAAARAALAPAAAPAAAVPSAPPGRVATCSVCDKRLDGRTVRACQFLDCPQTERDAA